MDLGDLDQDIRDLEAKATEIERGAAPLRAELHKAQAAQEAAKQDADAASAAAVAVQGKREPLTNRWKEAAEAAEVAANVVRKEEENMAKVESVLPVALKHQEVREAELAERLRLALAGCTRAEVDNLPTSAADAALPPMQYAEKLAARAAALRRDIERETKKRPREEEVVDRELKAKRRKYKHVSSSTDSMRHVVKAFKTAIKLRKKGLKKASREIGRKARRHQQHCAGPERSLQTAARVTFSVAQTETSTVARFLTGSTL